MPRYEEFVDAPPNDVAVRGFLHRPTVANGDGIVLTHGAGSNCESLLLASLAAALCDAGLSVLRCNLAFRQLRPKGPPPRGSAERDQEGLRRAVAAMRQIVSGRVFFGGHSYGGRQASMLSAAEPELVGALLLLSYPLHPPKKPEQLRVTHFANLKAPALFVHGIRDGFASVEELDAAIRLIPARTQVLQVSAGHELVSARTADAVTRGIAATFLEFVGASFPTRLSAD
jgi:predicted alpha/beta-hydrolase family hydrolase